MASRLNPYLSFAGDARQAMEFCERVFGGSLELVTFGQYGDADTPGADRIMHGMLVMPSGFTLMGADSAPGTDHQPGSAITVSLSGDDGEELRGYWEKLSEAGTVSTPLEKQMWGDEFGACVDRFGVPWLVNISESQG